MRDVAESNAGGVGFKQFWFRDTSRFDRVLSLGMVYSIHHPLHLVLYSHSSYRIYIDIPYILYVTRDVQLEPGSNLYCITKISL